MPPTRTVAKAREEARAPPMMRTTVRTPSTAMEAAMAAASLKATARDVRSAPAKKRERR